MSSGVVHVVDVWLSVVTVFRGMARARRSPSPQFLPVAHRCKQPIPHAHTHTHTYVRGRHTRDLATPPAEAFDLGTTAICLAKNRGRLRLVDVSRTPSGTLRGTFLLFNKSPPYLGDG